MDRAVNTDLRGPSHPAARAAIAWLVLGISALLTAGLLAIALVIARVPPLNQWITDPLLFRRVLVVHVDLSLVIWLYSVLAGMFCLIPRTKGKEKQARIGVHLGALGVTGMLVAALIPGAAPVLANYIPVIDHPLFIASIALFGLGVVVTFADRERLFGARGPGGEQGVELDELMDLPPAAYVGLRAAAISFMLAMVTLAIAAVTTPTFLPTKTYFEFAVWGGGHVLQFTSVLTMLTVWIIILSKATGAPILDRKVASVLFGIMVAPLLVAPLLAVGGTSSSTYYGGFTRLMRWGLFPVMSVTLLLCLWGLWRARAQGRLPKRWTRDASLLGFAASAGLAVLGMVLGAMIRESNTVVPGHYHAAIGAVTVALMVIAHQLFARFGYVVERPKLRRAIIWQPLLFAGGQMIFAMGFSFAGVHGAGRKVYGQEQHVRSLAEHIGLGVMGFGGLIAACGGVLFLVIAIAAWRGATQEKTRRLSWELNPSIPFKN